MNPIAKYLSSRVSRWPGPVACIAAATSLSACMNMSGLDASSNYSCPAPPGVVCKPMSEVYKTPAQPASAPAAAKPTNADVKLSQNSEDIQMLNSTLPAAPFVISDYRPLRSKPKVLRIWVGPFEDSDGDLHEEHRMYLQVDDGHWLIDHHVEEIRDAFAPLHAAPHGTNASGANPDKSERQPDKSPLANAGAMPHVSSEQPSAFDSAPATGGLK